MRKLLCAVLCIMLCFSLCSCVESVSTLPETLSNDEPQSSPTDDTIDPPKMGYTGDGSDLLIARELSTNRPVLITEMGEIVAELPISDGEEVYNIGENLLFIPGRGAVNYEGETVFGANYEYIGKFCHKLAPFSNNTDEEYKAGFVNPNGIERINDYVQTFPFSDGYAVVKAGESNWGYVNYFETLHALGYSDIKPFSEGLTAVSEDGILYGYLQPEGGYKIEPSFAEANSFSEGLAAIKLTKNGKFGYINTAGELVIQPTFNFMTEFWGGVAAVTYVDSKDTEYYFITPDGERAFENVFTEAIPLKNTSNKLWQVREKSEMVSYFMLPNSERILERFTPNYLNKLPTVF